MNFLRNIKNRVKFLIKESWYKNPLIIWYSITPSFILPKNRRWVNNYLEKKGFLKQNEKEKSFQLKDLKIFYNDRLPTGDIVSILLSRNSSVKNNFLNNSLTDFESSYELEGVKLEENDIVIDAGANIGSFSIFASKIIGKNGLVFSFEPIEETYSLLNKNVKINNTMNVQTIPCALGDINIEVDFFVNTDKLVSSSSEIQGENTLIKKVRQITLDSFLSEKPHINKINFIKVDIEGAERKFLDGAKNTIQKHKPKIAICIYHLPDDPEVIERKIKTFVPEYKITKNKTKLYAWVEK